MRPQGTLLVLVLVIGSPRVLGLEPIGSSCTCRSLSGSLQGLVLVYASNHARPDASAGAAESGRLSFLLLAFRSSAGTNHDTPEEESITTCMLPWFLKMILINRRLINVYTSREVQLLATSAPPLIRDGLMFGGRPVLPFAPLSDEHSTLRHDLNGPGQTRWWNVSAHITSMFPGAVSNNLQVACWWGGRHVTDWNTPDQTGLRQSFWITFHPDIKIMDLKILVLLVQI